MVDGDVCVFQVQPGDAIFVTLMSMNQDESTAGIPYDVGTPEECGVTTLVTYSGSLHEIVPYDGSVKQLDECWIMSYHLQLSQ